MPVVLWHAHRPMVVLQLIAGCILIACKLTYKLNSLLRIVGYDWRGFHYLSILM